MDEFEFRRRADQAMEALKRALMIAEEDADFEVEDQGGALHITFDEPPAHFVVSPNSAVHQIWISAHATSFKLEWSGEKKDFVFPKTGERLKLLVTRLMNEQFGEKAVELK
jgi:iron donor protein CyaY